MEWGQRQRPRPGCRRGRAGPWEGVLLHVSSYVALHGAVMPWRGEIATLLPATALALAVLGVCFASVDLQDGQYLLIEGFHFLSFQSDPFLPSVTP